MSSPAWLPASSIRTANGRTVNVLITCTWISRDVLELQSAIIRRVDCVHFFTLIWKSGRDKAGRVDRNLDYKPRNGHVTTVIIWTITEQPAHFSSGLALSLFGLERVDVCYSRISAHALGCFRVCHKHKANKAG